VPKAKEANLTDVNLPTSESELEALGIDPARVPRHIAIIMDGNGRWAKARNLPRALGHRQGVLALKPIVKATVSLGVQVLTVYAFSTENWIRPQAEVDALMDLLMEFLRKETQELKDQGVSIRAIGDVSALPKRAQEALNEAMETTSDQCRMILNLALNYGGRDELVRAVNRWLASVSMEGRWPPGEISEADLAKHLDTRGLPDPDLLIRSSGEERISNFMLWQIAYTEIYVTRTLWPDFTPTTLLEAISDFQRRTRRFGAAE
jgi:undecaprenyl diphosphate synthase